MNGTKEIIFDVVKTVSIVKQTLLFVGDVKVNEHEEVIKGVCTCTFIHVYHKVTYIEKWSYLTNPYQEHHTHWGVRLVLHVVMIGNGCLSLSHNIM